MSRKSTRSTRPALSLDARMGKIEEKIRRGKTQGALREAKSLAKAHPESDDVSGLLYRCYVARITGLEEVGQATEAVELIDAIRRRFPERAAELMVESNRISVQTGDVDDLLRSWARTDDRGERDELATLLRRHLVDPRAVTESSALPADDPLMATAHAVVAGLTSAASGTLDAAARDALRRVPRRSPLVAWRAFALALDAFHRRDDPACERYLDRIETEDAPGAVARLLRSLLHEELGDDHDCTAARVLRRRVTVGANELRREIDQLDHALHADGSDPDRAFEQLVRKLVRRDRGLAARLVRWAESDLAAPRIEWPYDNPEIEAAIGTAESLRLEAANSFEESRFDALVPSLSWFFKLSSQERKKLTKVELSILFETWAEGFEGADVWLEDLVEYGELPPDLLEQYWQTGLDTRNGHAIGAWMHSNPEGLSCLVHFELRDSLVGWLKELRARGELQSSATREGLASELVGFALESHPSQELYRKVLANSRSNSHEAQIIDAWAKDFPDAVEPLLHGMRSAEKRGAYTKALRLVARALDTAPLDPEVRRAHLRLRMATLVRHLQDGRFHLCERDLVHLEDLPGARTFERRLLFVAVRALIARAADATDAPSTPLSELDAVVLQLVERSTGPKQESRPVSVPGAGGEQLRNAVTLYRVASEIGDKPHRMVEPFDLDGDELRAALPDAPDQLETLCEFFESHERWSLAYLAAGHALRAAPSRVARFLAYRVRALQEVHADGLRVAEYWVFVAHFARRENDAVTIALAERFRWLSHGFEEVSDDSAATFLQREREASDELARCVRKPARRGRRTKKSARGKRRRNEPSDLAELAELADLIEQLELDLPMEEPPR